MIDVQTKMAGRALELLCLPKGQPCYLLDMGCGSGLSGDYLSDEGHCWVGIGISPAMLDAALDRDAEGDLLLGDMGQGIPFKPGSFDGCISISAIQWFCNANRRSDIPAKCLYCFSSLYSVLVRGGRAVLQLYPRTPSSWLHWWQVVDFPNSAKAKKFYLCLFSGPSTFMPKPLDESNESNEEEEVQEAAFPPERVPYRIARRGGEWEVRPDTQYPRRRRKPRF
ncbi:unnamed protein product [Nyctereutes procyonoides]|uniref:(raccoon dog) hypothetical protein n=1 Tax=Nyctereutes procyonoides TaxID=34880 RepID=A0A811Y9F7_NYCPR|nr:unnamed protein product [Nyctereutes procyonoides]